MDVSGINFVNIYSLNIFVLLCKNVCEVLNFEN